MIVTGKARRSNPKVSAIGTRPSRAAYGPAMYEIGKNIVKSYGYYQDIEQYLPDKYVERYTYKPHKRAYGYARLSKGFLRKKSTFFTSRKFNQKCSGSERWSNWNTDWRSPC